MMMITRPLLDHLCKKKKESMAYVMSIELQAVLSANSGIMV